MHTNDELYDVMLCHSENSSCCPVILCDKEPLSLSISVSLYYQRFSICQLVLQTICFSSSFSFQHSFSLLSCSVQSISLFAIVLPAVVLSSLFAGLQFVQIITNSRFLCNSCMSVRIFVHLYDHHSIHSKLIASFKPSIIFLLRHFEH